MTGAGLTPSVRLTAAHDVSQFDCGTPELTSWLVRHALKNEAGGGSRTYVVCHRNDVVGYYSLAAGAIARAEAPKPMQRNMPDPIPVMVLGRLAVDRTWQGQGIGKNLLQDAILRVLQAAEIASVKAILAHAISEDVKNFYLDRSFLESPIEPMTLCLLLETARRALVE
jgi:GNAT superfamily N-acetyltransferase